MYKDPNDPRRAESSRRYYEKNKAAYLLRAKNQRDTLRDWVRELKNNPCTDCGTQYPYYVMQFDHVRGDKVEDITRLLLRGNRQLLTDELEKCELVCANCHAERTWGRLQK